MSIHTHVPTYSSMLNVLTYLNDSSPRLQYSTSSLYVPIGVLPAKYYKKLIMKWHSERELFTMTSCMYYKIQKKHSNEAEVYTFTFAKNLSLILCTSTFKMRQFLTANRQLVCLCWKGHLSIWHLNAWPSEYPKCLYDHILSRPTLTFWPQNLISSPLSPTAPKL